MELTEWDIEELIDRRRTDDGLEYLVRWKDSRLAAHHVQLRPDGGKFVACSQREWEVVAAVEVNHGGDRGERCLEIVWEDSWSNRADLQNAQDLVDAFDAALPVEPAETRNDRLERGLQPAELDNFFKPKAGVNYSRAIRAHLAEKTGPSIRDMLEADPVRPVVFSDAFVESKTLVNITRGSKALAILAHDSGYEQPVPCEPCQNGIGPFAECVARHSGVGVCTNCQFNEKGPLCNFHGKRESSLSGTP